MTDASRRRFLATAVAVTAVTAGCRDDGSSGTAGPDERITAEPPAGRPLSPSGSWPQAGFDAGNTGYNPDGRGVRDGERYWRLDAGRHPVVTSDGLYNVFQHKVSPKQLMGRDPATAEIRSSTDLVGSGVTSPPAVGNYVYVATFSRPWAVRHNGDVAWEGPVVDGLYAPPTIRDGRVYVAGRGYDGRNNPPKVAALTSDGDTAWEFSLDRPADGAPATDGDLTVVATDESVIGLDGGEERWRYDATTPEGTPVLANGQVFFPGEAAIHAVDAADGSEAWHAGPGTESLVVTGDHVIAAGDERTVALDRATGEAAWEQPQGGRPLAAAGSTLYTARDGRLRVLGLDGGDFLWSYYTSEVTVADQVFMGITGVTPVDGAVYVRAADALHGIGPVDS